jgi:hypothetical protein
MKAGQIIHQQIRQLRWPFLACLGLIMVLPLEEAVVNLLEGNGFYSANIVLVSMMFAPLLAGLIACANVQADFDDKRYIFWRSKPVGVKSFMAMKYFIGLLISFAMIAFPVVFSIVSSLIADTNEVDLGVYQFMVNLLFISLMAYSLCFFCNTLVRKTARSWLIGLAMTVLLLLVPFMLPLNYKDTRDFMFTASVIYLSVTLGPSSIAFILSLFAVSRDWHLQTNLKGLLWTGTALIYLLLLLFTREVANLKVLDTITVRGYARLMKICQDYEFGTNTVDVTKNRIRLSDKGIDSIEPYQYLRAEKISRYENKNDLKLATYPEETFIYYETGGQQYALSLCKYFRVEKEEYKEGRFRDIHIDKECYLKAFKVDDGQYAPIASLYLSDCLGESSRGILTMRIIGNTIIAFVNDQCITIAISQTGQIKRMGKAKIKRYLSQHMLNWEQDFKIPLVPAEGIEIKERIRASVDFNFGGGHLTSDYFARRTLVDIHDNKISFYYIYRGQIARFEVFEWNEEYVYCRFRDDRPFTFLEQRLESVGDGWCFVEDGKLYAYHNTTFMIFDIRSERMRKLGHWERWADDYWIQEIETLENGNILLGARERKRINDGKQWEWISYLYLLQNPE